MTDDYSNAYSASELHQHSMLTTGMTAAMNVAAAGWQKMIKVDRCEVKNICLAVCLT
ncbi:hypothetical protein QWY20_14405 [Alkalimonas sp. MEB108]|uniref:Uncharacterized protein n=1 Tax=Alkalimonas cellulosilytica TaxID=3058395 RepID=A0ABU7J7Y8_9GAMM|nr:hypothetical protein [Alkalimonas sp. MEB108]MEE2002648.1 hypothetical protein [Alkalimonas sp. MEB108]